MLNEEKIIELFMQKNSLRQIEKLTNVSYYKIVKILENKKLYKKTKNKKTNWNLILVKKYIKEKHGPNVDCLSEIYQSMHTKMLWKCANPSHPLFRAEWNSIYRQDSWCRKCWDERRSETFTSITIDDCKNEALKRGGKCISKKYKNGKRLQFICSNNHIFYRTWNEIQHAERWCPQCKKTFRNQEICRQIFQNIFGKEFKETNLADIGIEEAGKLRYDGYNPELKLAFEYNGEFHYKKIFKNQDLDKQIENDIRKAKLSSAYGIKLIQIKYFPKKSKIDRFCYIEKILRENGIDISSGYKKDIELNDIYYHNYYEEIKKIIEDKGGNLLSKEILDSTTDIKIKCGNRHIFYMSPHKLKAGQWCKCQMKNRSLTKEEIEKTIEHYGGKVIEIYKEKLWCVKYFCDEGHLQDKEVRRVRDGRWCDCIEHKGKKNMSLILCEMIIIQNNK